MPPRSSLTSSFSVSDANNEVVCPLRNQDGSSCRKRCLGEKRYRSMQEHIRRAHPEHYISKLPATEESFALMINTPPSERPRESTSQGIGPAPYPPEKHPLRRLHSGSPATPRHAEDHASGSLLPAASAAAALAQLHHHTVDNDWDSEQPRPSSSGSTGSLLPNRAEDLRSMAQDAMSEMEPQQRLTSSIELPGIAQMKQEAGLNYPHPLDAGRPRQLLPSILSRSPPGRSSTLPPIQRRDKPARPRKSSITQNAKKPQHERKKSRGENARRLSYEGRKAFSAEPTRPASGLGKRWEDLIDAATTATEEAEDDRRTPVPYTSPAAHRASLPPFPTAHLQSYQASPLQHALTPPSYAPDPFPSVESGDNFHIESRGLEDSSPTSSSQNVHIYCAACQRATLLRASFACTECICGICRECVDVLVAEQGARRRCPKCGTIGGRFRPFQLDLR